MWGLCCLHMHIAKKCTVLTEKKKIFFFWSRIGDCSNELYFLKALDTYVSQLKPKKACGAMPGSCWYKQLQFALIPVFIWVVLHLKLTRIVTEVLVFYPQLQWLMIRKEESFRKGESHYFDTRSFLLICFERGFGRSVGAWLSLCAMCLCPYYATRPNFSSCVFLSANN